MDSARQLRSNRLVPVQHINSARDLVVDDVVLASNTHRDVVHDLPRSPASELRNIYQVGGYEGESIRVIAERLLVSLVRACTQLDYRAGIGRRGGHVLFRARHNDGRGK